MPNRISEGRKTAYYLGMGLQVLGGLLFAILVRCGSLRKFV